MPSIRSTAKKQETKQIELEMEETISMHAVVDLNEFSSFYEEEIGQSEQDNKEHKKQDKKSQKNLATEQFNKYLLETIDETLGSLGEPVKNTFYQHLESDFEISKDEIPEKITDFSLMLRKLFGLGASRLEARMVKNLRLKFKNKGGLPECEMTSSKWLSVDFSFTNYVCYARTCFEKAHAGKKQTRR